MSRLFKSQRVAFTQAPNLIIQNKELSFKARGIWVYLESKPDDWKFSLKRISDDSPDGIDGVRTGIAELEKYGYLERKLAYTEDGQFNGYDYTILTEPSLVFPTTEKPSTEKPSTEKPSTEKPTTNKERESNKDLIIKKNKFFLLRAGAKIFQKEVEGRYLYENEKYIMFNDTSEVANGKIIIPEIFILDFLQDQHPIRFEGLLKFFDGNIQEKTSKFIKVAQVLFKERSSSTFEDIDHFANTVRKIANDMERSRNYKSNATQKKVTFVEGQENIF